MEKLTSDLLRSKGYEEFLPLYVSKRRWSDRVKSIECPLFPGYLFCRLDANRRLPVLTTPGVSAIVSAGRMPIAVPDEEIEAVRTVLASGLGAQPWPFIAVGSTIRLERGPLAGLEGLVTSADKIDRLVVSVSLLQRSVAVEIDRSWVRKISDPCSSDRSGWQAVKETQIGILAQRSRPVASLASTAI